MQFESANCDLPLSEVEEIPGFYLPPVGEDDAESGDGDEDHRTVLYCTVLYCSYLPPVGEDDAESGDGDKDHPAHAPRHHHQAQAGRRGLGGRAVLHCLEVSHAWKTKT